MNVVRRKTWRAVNERLKNEVQPKEPKVPPAETIDQARTYTKALAAILDNQRTVTSLKEARRSVIAQAESVINNFDRSQVELLTQYFGPIPDHRKFGKFIERVSAAATNAAAVVDIGVESAQRMTSHTAAIKTQLAPGAEAGPDAVRSF